ncbi:unnamed protein product [Urochloa humidicola]
MMRKDAVVAVLLVLMLTSGSATHAAARAFPEELPASPGGTANNAPPPRTSSEHGRGLLPVEENKSAAGHSCGTFDKNNKCPPPRR